MLTRMGSRRTIISRSFVLRRLLTPGFWLLAPLSELLELLELLLFVLSA